MVVDSSAGCGRKSARRSSDNDAPGLSQERIVLVLLLTLAILFVLSLVLPGFEQSQIGSISSAVFPLLA
jgi:hypothetical protein